MAEIKQDSIYREMVDDLCFRLRLADDLFDHTTDALLTAINLEDFAAKTQTTNQLNDYSLALQLIYTDFKHLIARRSVHFPAAVSQWQWNEDDAEELITLTLERLRCIADGMLRALHCELENRGEAQ